MIHLILLLRGYIWIYVKKTQKIKQEGCKMCIVSLQEFQGQSIVVFIISTFIYLINPLMPVGNYSYQFFICCPRDCVSRHNGGTSGAPFKPPRVDSALRALSTLRGLRGAPEVPPLCRETQSLGQQMKNW